MPNYTQKDWDAAASNALTSLRAWERQYLDRGMKGRVWPYELDQVKSAVENVKLLLKYLNGQDPRKSEY